MSKFHKGSEGRYNVPDFRSKSSFNYRNYPKMMENENNFMRYFFKSYSNNNSNDFLDLDVSSYGRSGYVDLTDYEDSNYTDTYNTTHNNKKYGRTYNNKEHSKILRQNKYINELFNSNVKHNNTQSDDDDWDSINSSSNAQAAPSGAMESQNPWKSTHTSESKKPEDTKKVEATKTTEVNVYQPAEGPPAEKKEWKTVYELKPAPSLESILEKEIEDMSVPQRARYKKYCWKRARTAMDYKAVKDLCKTIARCEASGMTEAEMDYETAMKDVLKMFKELGVGPGDYEMLRDCVMKRKKGSKSSVRSGKSGSFESEPYKSGSGSLYYTPKAHFSGCFP